MNPPTNDKPSLLLVDDDETFCKVLSRALEKRGFDVTTANNVEQRYLWQKPIHPNSPWLI